MRHRLRFGLSAVVAVATVAAVFAVPAQSDGTGPLIVGNNARFGGGPIQTFDYAVGGPPVASFVPDGAFGSNNGRGVAVAGNEVFYTELSGSGFGPTDFIRVAPFNNGTGGSDIRTLPNPDPSTGIADLAFANGALYAMTGYREGALQVWKLDPLTGAQLAPPVPIGPPATAPADGFVVLPNGNFLINEGDTSCTYDQYNPLTGVATGTSFTVAGHSICTGVDTDGTSLYIETDFSSFTKTDLSGNVISNTPVAGENQGVEDISLVHAVGLTISSLSPVHAWIGLKNSDDQGTQFDLKAELYDGSTLVASGLTRCITGVTRNPSLAKDGVVNWDSFPSTTASSGDVLSLKISTRIGTNPDNTKCAGHSSAVGLRLYYDSTTRNSRFDINDVNQYLHSDGNPCANAESTGVTTRWFDSTAPTATAAKCKDSSSVSFAGGNPWKEIGTWSMTVP